MKDVSRMGRNRPQRRSDRWQLVVQAGRSAADSRARRRIQPPRL